MGAVLFEAATHAHDVVDEVAALSGRCYRGWV
jgi:hypothetical protein